MSKRKILLINDGLGPDRAFTYLDLPFTQDVRLLESNPGSIALAVFTGGADIGPELYGHKNYRSSSSPRRDHVEVWAFEQARKHDLPIAGICRGAQFLCAMAGGALVQDITNHTGGDHTIQTSDGDVVSVTSCHHQMQYPWDINEDDYEILATTPEPRSAHYFYEDREIPAAEASPELRQEVEAILYKPLKAVGVQFHPEWMNPRGKGYAYFQRLVEQYLIPHIHALPQAASRNA
jgi:gamma-glutamyl-gamma-aminobutyrate hydrolase PuuD